ncbi:MAG: tetratricopeptide repeat protein, partial [Alphaproteobacteria bacterium]|nr:tetratricopeptide repeat protein [Alphaproteobacteria bacterium]
MDTPFTDQRDAVLQKARRLRLDKRTDDSLAVLAQLEVEYPDFSLLHQEKGLCYVALRQAPAAIGALLKAVNLNPALPASWHMLEGLYRLTGDQTNTAMAATHVATLAALPTEVVQATALFADGDIKPAEEMIRAFLLREGDHPEAMRLLAKIALHYDVLDDAEALLGGVLALVPDHHAARFDYATVLVKRQKYGAAQAEVARLQAHDTGNLDYQALAATIAGGSGRHDAAIALYQAMIAQQPDDADIYLWLGHALKTVGRLDEAIVTYRGAIARRADFGDAWWSLANLKTYRFSADDIAAMRAQEARTDVAEIDRVHLAFALGKALEDARDYEQSWHYYAQGNALQRQNSKYRPEIMETNTRLQRQVCT